MTAGDVLATEAEHPFKLIPARANGQTFYFSAGSLVEQKVTNRICL